MAGIAISARSRDIRVAQQLGMLASLPSVAVTSLIAFGVIPVSLGLAAGSAVPLLVLNRLGWRFTSAALDRERRIAGSSPTAGRTRLLRLRPFHR